MGAEVERFLGAGRALADHQGLPTTSPDINMSWRSGDVHTIELGTMLGQVAIMPQETDRVTLVGYSGDQEMIRKLHASEAAGHLSIQGELPFKPGSSGRFSGGSYNVFGEGVVITGGSVYVGGNSSFSSTRGGERMLIVNGREVDMSRAIQLGLIVPVGTNVRVGDMVGAVGIGPNLGGSLDFGARFDTHVFAYDTTELTGQISGQGRADVGRVDGLADISMSGQGDFALGSVGGKLDASVSGQGNIRVNGGSSSSMRAKVSGQGSITHRGTVLGDARLRVSGMGNIHVGQVNGRVDAQVSGMGSIQANGQTYRPRW